MEIQDRVYRLLIQQKANELLAAQCDSISAESYKTVQDWFEAFASNYTDEIYDVDVENIATDVIDVLAKLRMNFSQIYKSNYQKLGWLRVIYRILRWREYSNIAQILRETEWLIKTVGL